MSREVSSKKENSSKDAEELIQLIIFLNNSTDSNFFLYHIKNLLTINNNANSQTQATDSIEDAAVLIANTTLTPFIALKNFIFNGKEVTASIELAKNPEKLTQILSSQIFWQTLLDAKVAKESKDSLITALIDKYEKNILEILPVVLDNNLPTANYCDKETLAALISLIRNISNLDLKDKEKEALSASLSKLITSLIKKSSDEYDLSTVKLFQSVSEILNNEGIAILFAPGKIKETSNQLGALVAQSIVQYDKHKDRLKAKSAAFKQKIENDPTYDKKTKEYLINILIKTPPIKSSDEIMRGIKEEIDGLEITLQEYEKQKEAIEKSIQTVKKTTQRTEQNERSWLTWTIEHLGLSVDPNELATNLVTNNYGYDSQLSETEKSINSTQEKLSEKKKLIQSLQKDIETATELNKYNNLIKNFENTSETQKALSSITEAAVSSILSRPKKKKELVECANIAFGIWEKSIIGDNQQYDFGKLITNSTALLAHLSSDENFTKTAADSLGIISNNASSKDAKVATKLASIFFEGCTRNKGANKEILCSEIQNFGQSIEGRDNKKANFDHITILGQENVGDKPDNQSQESILSDKAIQKELLLLKENLDKSQSDWIVMKTYYTLGIIRRSMNLSSIILSQFTKEELKEYESQIGLKSYIKEKIVENILADKPDLDHDEQKKIKQATEKTMEESKILDNLANYVENSRKGNKFAAFRNLLSVCHKYFFYIPNKVNKKITTKHAVNKENRPNSQLVNRRSSQCR
ncbi:MAG: hypothetical protein SFT68_03155 [Rickettsiaceae bacterium]|nr:hypothetical protein [Rickettsiaceae bacterium]